MSEPASSGTAIIDWTKDVPMDFVVRITDHAHNADDASKHGHRGGFCSACAAIYVAVEEALIDASDAAKNGRKSEAQ